MKRIYFLIAFVVALSASAQKIPFQGRLLDNGAPFNGIATLDFSIATPAWSESIADVTVTDGYYSVVLGEITPLPDTLFNNNPEVALSISVNGQALSPVTLYAPLLPDLASLPISVDTVETNRLSVRSKDDEERVRGYVTENGFGGVTLYDSLGRGGAAQLRTGTSGGVLQLAQQRYTDNSFSSAILASQLGDENARIAVYGGNAAGDNIQLMFNSYAANTFADGTPLPDGYRRGGIDIYNYFGNTTHNIFSEHNGTSTTSLMNLVAGQDTGEQTYSLILSSGDGVSTGGSINMTDATGAGSISLDGTNGRIDAQEILINGVPVGGSGGGTISPDSVKAKSVQVLGAGGEVKADLNFFAQNNAGSLVLNGANDSTKVILGSAFAGYGSFLGLYDSTRNIGVQARVTSKGLGNVFTYNEAHVNTGWFGGIGNDGFMQVISYDSTETISGAALVGSFADGSLPEYYLEGSAQANFGLGRYRVTPLGNSTEETAMMEINRSNGGGQAVMTIIQDEAGPDPTGATGSLSLWGDSSPNFILGKNQFGTHNQSEFNMYGSIPTPDGLWWYNTGRIGTLESGSGSEYAYLGFANNQPGGSTETVVLTANSNDSGAGGLSLSDSTGFARLEAVGSQGSLSVKGEDTESNGWFGNNWLDGGTEQQNRGGIILWGDVATRTALNGQDIRRVALRVADDGFGKDIGKLSLRGPIEGDNLLVDLGGTTGDGVNYRGDLTLRNNNGGSALMTSDLNGTGAGGIELLDNTGTASIIMDASTGTINAEQVFVQGVPLGAAGGNITPDTITTNYITALNGAGNEGVYLRGNAEGGTLQLSSPDATNTFNRALFFAGTTANGENSFANLYGMNPTADGNQLLISNYNTINSVFGTPFSAGYRRGGTDYFDNDGTFLAGIGSNRDESGGDPSGKSGLVLVNGTTTRNGYLSGKWWENANLGILQIFGQNDDGTGLNGTLAVAELQAVDQAGNTSANLSLFNTDAGGASVETVLIQSNAGAGAGILIKDNIGTNTIDMNGEAGNITANGTVNADILQSTSGTVQTSDRRLKKNIETLENPLEKTLQMRGVSYQWKDENKSQRNQIGVIAQEVEAIYPEFVHTNEKGMKAVNYAQMTAVLIEAIKELNAKVESLENENSTLKASLSEVETLRKEMDQLMKMLGGSKAASK